VPTWVNPEHPRLNTPKWRGDADRQPPQADPTTPVDRSSAQVSDLHRRLCGWSSARRLGAGSGAPTAARLSGRTPAQCTNRD